MVNDAIAITQDGVDALGDEFRVSLAQPTQERDEARTLDSRGVDQQNPAVALEFIQLER
jgi:hypothetical protein